MPALPNVANVLRADVLWNDGSDTDVSTRFFFRYSGGPPNATDATNFGADLYSLIAAHDALWSTEVVLTGVRVTDLSTATGGQGEHAQSTAGTNSSAVLAGGTAVLVNGIISRRYRGGKPRNYLPWLTSADLNSRQQWLGSSVTAVDSALSAIFTGFIGQVEGSTTITEHVNVSYYSGFTVVTNPSTGRAKNVPKLRTTPVVDAILSYAVSSRPASQRRRN